MLKPLNDKVAVVLAKPKMSIGNIILPQIARGRQEVQEGMVVAVGPGRLNKNGVLLPMSVQVGDRVLVNWGGIDVEVYGIKYRIIQDSDILVVLE